MDNSVLLLLNQTTPSLSPWYGCNTVVMHPGQFVTRSVLGSDIIQCKNAQAVSGQKYLHQFLEHSIKAAIVETNAPPKLPVRGPVRGFKGVETVETDCKVPVLFDETVVPVFGKPATVDTVPEAVAGACTICAV